MERLTERLNNLKRGVSQMDDKEEIKVNKNFLKSVCEYLEQLKFYKNAEEQGLLLRLPCKVGDAVYHESQYSTVHKGVQAYQITNIMISQNKKGEWTKKYRGMMLLNGRIVDSQLNFSFDDLGKTVFLTKEQAEQALKQMGERDDE